jgi:DNA polymerase elongation subunit (family B)
MTTMDEYVSFSSYYLWFLIDNFGFEIEHTKKMRIFYKNEKGLFTEFTENLMKERRKATTENNKGLAQFCKNCLNAAYGKDIMNTANYNRLSIRIKNKHFLLNVILILLVVEK